MTPGPSGLSALSSPAAQNDHHFNEYEGRLCTEQTAALAPNWYSTTLLRCTELPLPSRYEARTFTVAYPGILFVGGVQQIQLRTENRENGDLGAVAP